MSALGQNVFLVGNATGRYVTRIAALERELLESTKQFPLAVVVKQSKALSKY